MLVTGARGPAAAAPGTDEAEHRMVVRKRRNAGCPLPARPGVNGGSGNEPPSSPANTGEGAPLNQPPDRRTRDTQRATGFLNRDHACRHVIIVS